MPSQVFHLAIPTHNLDEAQSYYEKLGCEMARRYDDRITLNFFGEQVVCHLSKKIDQEPEMYPRHFGITFADKENYDRVLSRADKENLPFFTKPFVRFDGKREEHHTFFLKDPSNNLIEFKYYADPAMMY